MLAERAPELCGALLPAGRRVHGHWHVGSVSGESGKSLEVELVGDKAGLWLDRATGDGGDALNLVQAALGLRTPEALAWARRWLGIPDESGPRQRSRETAQRWSPRAEKLWREIRPLSGSIGARYLSDRGCVPPESDEVRFHPDLLHWPSGSTWPTLVSRITDTITAEPMTLHLTFLAHDGGGKAPVEKPKLLLPAHAKQGGVVRLVDDADVTTGLGIAEGIETALAVMAAGWSPVWATVDSGNLAKFPVLEGIEALTVFVDHDDSGEGAAKDVAQRWRAVGREARICIPPDSATDWNDRLNELVG